MYRAEGRWKLIFINDTNISIDKNTIAEFLKTYTMQYPYDANLYAIAYLYFGSGAGDLEDITKYLGIYDSFVDCAKEPVFLN